MRSEGADGDDRRGQRLGGKYLLLRKIGEGGMGEVYEARHEVLGRRLAVKLLHPELVRNRKLLNRFSREALAASRIESEHVVPAIDCGHTPDGVPYYVMELLRGRDLRQVLRAERQLAEPRVARLALDVCRGLHAAHAQGIVHRDLKPENLFLVRRDDGREMVKILDFGVARFGSGNSTGAGALVGTARYMAPEQVEGNAPIDQRTDVYALGVILYECLAGESPYPGQTATETYFQIMNAVPKALSERRPHLAAGFERTVMRAMHRAPERRYRDVMELGEALVAFAGADARPVRADPSVVSEPADANTAALTPAGAVVHRRARFKVAPALAWFALLVVLSAVLLAAGSHSARRSESGPAESPSPRNATALSPPPKLDRAESVLPGPDRSAVPSRTEDSPALAPAPRPAFVEAGSRDPRHAAGRTRGSAVSPETSDAPRSSAPGLRFDLANPYDPAPKSTAP